MSISQLANYTQHHIWWVVGR